MIIADQDYNRHMLHTAFWRMIMLFNTYSSTFVISLQYIFHFKVPECGHNDASCQINIDSTEMTERIHTLEKVDLVQACFSLHPMSASVHSVFAVFVSSPSQSL